MPAAKLMAHGADSVLDPSNLTSRVTKLVSMLRKAQISSKQQLKEQIGVNKLQWLLDCITPWYSK